MTGSSDQPAVVWTLADVVRGVIRAFEQYYVLAEVAERVHDGLGEQLRAGVYDATPSGDALASALTADLHAITGDRHTAVRFHPEPQPTDQPGPSAAEQERWRREALARNFGFRRVEILAGNVGYVEILEFGRPEEAGETAVAAMAFVANTLALVFDLRLCGGGHASMLDLVSTYLFEKKVHLNDFYWRHEDRTEQFWTLPYVPGRRYLGKPVYVLTSAQTFSAGEGFAYSLQQLGRATVVGETTMGGAHPGDAKAVQRIHPHFIVGVPTGRAINPITGTNWEGVGVKPDVPVESGRALEVAHAEALKQILASADADPTGPAAQVADEARRVLSSSDSRGSPR